MAAITIRNLDENVKAELKVRAGLNGRSMEAEARAILESATNQRRRPKNLAVALIELGEKYGPVDIPPREPESTHDPFADWTDEDWRSFDDRP